ncbi:MAG TPA: NAD(P) transhydrogenase subunit alpha [Bacillota bacterium]|jgi:NAD(P) transhydrogenase subunit alpha|nr:NAD(P) transhydrogenase subunit alpha [Candidatus Fermentithermobacillaceae bacterium]HOB30700.1 NAD(P) transhydrogenase subunit alpha [Bacillota bacterium]HOK64556.1 NAD(P) transhydrogenase subunit alpha [Bacillota bacterium]HOL12069.1 NAD(P) transhydrogenase subunit alpha [Bacillota bacterium]HOQ03095.1 NAD(P) transhydrogenase subunit alpha [Bacillota bacterium]
MDALFNLIVFAVAAWLGYIVISEVPSLLHTPLMSGTNAISGVTILGSLVSAALAVNLGSKILAFVAIIFACVNLVGGFLVTDRMLRMFKN